MLDMISVIVPVYNAEQYLDECLNSIKAQTYSDLEIICVNDGSTDRSKKIVESFCQQDSRFTLLDIENNGVSNARNHAIEIAKGKYIMFVDADDWIDAETCEIAIKMIRKHEADVVMWSYMSENDGGPSPKKIFNGNKIFETHETVGKLHQRFVGITGKELSHPEMADSLCPVWGKLYKKNVIVDNEVKFVDLEKIGTYEDGLFNLEVFGHINKAIYLDGYYYHYRRNNSNSTTAKYNERLFEQWENLYKIIGEYIKMNHLTESYRCALNNRIALGILGQTLNVNSSNKSFLKKQKELKRILKDQEIHNALLNLKIAEMPIHWKMFYSFAKFENAFGLLIAGNCIQIIIKNRR